MFKTIAKVLIVVIANAVNLTCRSISDIEYQSSNIESSFQSSSYFEYVYPGNSIEDCTYINIDSRDPILLVGDSRTVGLHMLTQLDDISYLAKGSMGFDWLSNGTSEYNPTDLICNYLDANPEGNVVINLGVNDIHNERNYSQWVNKVASMYPEANWYYMSVNPAKSRPDLDIVGFNYFLESNIPDNVNWIDCYSYLQQNGFSASDGVHYDKVTYEKVVDCLLNVIFPEY